MALVHPCCYTETVRKAGRKGRTKTTLTSDNTVSLIQTRGSHLGRRRPLSHQAPPQQIQRRARVASPNARRGARQLASLPPPGAPLRLRRRRPCLRLPLDPKGRDPPGVPRKLCLFCRPGLQPRRKDGLGHLMDLSGKGLARLCLRLRFRFLLLLLPRPRGLVAPVVHGGGGGHVVGALGPVLGGLLVLDVLSAISGKREGGRGELGQSPTG